MITKKTKKHSPLLAILFILLALVVFVIPVTTTAFADSSELDEASEIRYTDVVTDFNADPNFDYNKYPVDGSDHGIYLIQVAESVNSELFMYMYAPSKIDGDIGCWIRFNTQKDSAVGMRDYKLKLLSSSGTLSKWLVEDFTVSTANIRVYNIVQLMRTWYTYIDGDPTDEYGNIQRTKAYEVRSCVTASTYKDKVVYEATALDVITITYKEPGTLRYTKTSGINKYYTTSFYLAFDTDRRMDRLVEADIEYRIRAENPASDQVIITPPDTEPATKKTLRADEYESAQYGTTFWTKKHTWSLIQSVDDFKATENLTDDAISALDKAKWVLRYESFSQGPFNDITHKEPVTFYSGYGITILRLKFITDGIVYDLGVVDNVTDQNPLGPGDGGNHDTTNPGDEDTVFDKTPWKPGWSGGTGSDGPGDGGSGSDGGSFWDKVKNFFSSIWGKIKDFFNNKVPDWVYWLLIALAAVLIFPILFAIIPGFFSAFVTLLKYIGKGIVWLVTLPVKGIAKLVNYIKEKRADKS